MELVFGAGKIDRTVAEAETLLRAYRNDIGYAYLRYRPITPVDKLVPEDLAVTLLVNSYANYKAFQSLQEHAETINLQVLPERPLEQISDVELKVVAETIARVASWPGFAASRATKVLHKKRPELIPILDNQAIFGAYMKPEWPKQPPWRDSIKNQDQIEQALNWIRFDLLRPENTDAWPVLGAMEPTHSLIQIFDSVWWMYFYSEEERRKQQSKHRSST